MASSGYVILLIGSIIGLVVVGGAMTGFDLGNNASSVPNPGGESGGDVTVDVVGMSGPDAVRPDEGFTVTVAVANPGETAAEQPLALRMDADDADQLPVMIESKTVTVPAGEQKDVPFTVNPKQTYPGQFEFGVMLGETEVSPAATAHIDVLRPPTFSLVDKPTGPTAVRGSNATITAEITNDGDYRGLETVQFAVDENRDGQYSAEETSAEAVLSIAGQDQETTDFTIQTAGLEPGEYDYRITSGNSSTTGTLTVEQPATFHVQRTATPDTVTRGETVNVTAEVENVGDIDGTATVTFSGGTNTTNQTRTVTLGANETTRVTFSANTTNRTRGMHNYTISTDSDTATAPVRVEDSHFEVSELRGPEVLYVGDTAVFSATIRNAGNVSGTQTVEHRIDSDEDDRPEAYGVDRTISLDPGEETRVTFELEYTLLDTTDYPVEPLKLQTYIYGIYSEDTRASSAMSIKPSWAKDGGSSSGGSGIDEPAAGGEASLDQITQEKYGYYFHEVSGETQGQIREIHERQPFADGLATAEVKTREEIAREDYGADVGYGENFDFTTLDIEVQQDVEADFDAQFQSDEGDRIESWDELARAEYGSDYADLTDSQQEEIRTQYQEQFD